jgi:8-oxo-(d)GTP phosphatase
MTDRERPLDDDGRQQAKLIATVLADAGITRILSSPATRCLQTVTPLADQLGLAIEEHEALFEGDHDGALDLAEDFARTATTAVLSSHGDIIPAIIDTLYYRGVDVDRPGKCAKGSIWTLNVTGGAITAASYHKPR